MAVGKRTSTDQPLTEHDVAERLDRAALRLLRLLIEIRNLGIVEQVKGSRYHTNALDLVEKEIATWRS
jgi:hypothetical protein